MANTVKKQPTTSGATTTATFNVKADKNVSQDTTNTPNGTANEESTSVPTEQEVASTPTEIPLEPANGFERTLIGDYIVETPLAAVRQEEVLDKTAVVKNEEDDLQK